MTADRDTDEGNQIHLVPVAPGVQVVAAGGGLLVLGPLFGFLIGSILGTDGTVLGTRPIFFFLFLGFLVAGVGLGIVMLGARRILRHRHAEHPDRP